MRVIGKAADVVARGVAAEGVEHQEGVEPALQVLRQHAHELDARAVAGGLAGDQAFDAARGGDGGDGSEGGVRVHALTVGRRGDRAHHAVLHAAFSFT